MEDSIIYIVSAENLSSEKVILLFNFKDDLLKEIWGGKCVSRPFQGKNLNLVLFDLKKLNLRKGTNGKLLGMVEKWILLQRRS